MRYKLVTGSAGFIGFNLSRKLLERGDNIIGIDNHNDYYDPKIKDARLARLIKYSNYQHYRADLSDQKNINDIFRDHQVEKVINLAAQAGVRYSMENPLAYINSNILGFANILENCRKHNIEHLVYASTSSVYGANTLMPFSEHDSVNHPLSVYAASKKSNELMAHAYSYLYKLPTTGLRFFTVYGPWGRPDMALYKFTKGINTNKAVEVFNNGNMWRDFTYIDDLVESIYRLKNLIPSEKSRVKNDSLSKICPFRIVNIGNQSPTKLINFINILEKISKKKLKKKFLPMQMGDVKYTSADCSLLKRLIGFVPNTSVEDGILNFYKWYKNYKDNFK